MGITPFFRTLINTSQTLIGAEFSILPFLFVETGIFYFAIVILSGINSIISLYLYRIIQEKCGLYTITDLSQYSGGRIVLQITRIMKIIYKIILIGIIITIISTSIETMVLRKSEEQRKEWWKGNSIIKVILITLFIPILYFISNYKTMIKISEYYSYVLPLLFIVEFIYSIGSIIFNGVAMNNNIINNIWSNVGHHQIFPSYSLVLCIFAPFKNKNEEPSESSLGVMVSYIFVLLFALLYGFLIGISLGQSTTSMPFSSFMLIYYDDPYFYSLALIINIFIVIIFSFQILSYFSLVLDDIESYFFTSWQPSKRRKFILSMVILSVVGLSSSLFWQCNIQISLNGCIPIAYFVHFLPASLALFLSNNKTTKLVSILLIIFGVLFSSSGISSSLITFIQNAYDNYSL